MSDTAFEVVDSVKHQRWVKRCDDLNAVRDMQRQTGVGFLTAELMVGRGITPENADDFLNPTLKNLLPNPSLLQDMDAAASLIWDAIEANAAITVFADYDVDGGSSAAQLIRWGRHLSRDFGLYVPDRVKEGYGPTSAAFESLARSGVDLVITVDCGAAAHDALVTADEIGLPVIVVDHHLMSEDRPPAAALVNPNRSDDTSGCGHLAAAGVTFLLLVALNREGRRRGVTDLPDLRRFLDLAAMGTVCDVVPLTDINRAFVTQGLSIMSREDNTGLRALAEVAKVSPPFSGYHIGFILGPRINAGGRIGRANMGAQLLAADEETQAFDWAEQLDRVNTDRKILQARILEEAITKANALPDSDSIILVSMEGWHPGIIGIVAGRLKDQFGKPAIVIGIDDSGTAKGSGRSISGVNLGGAISAAKDVGLLSSGGGHAMAGGLTTRQDKIAELSDFLNAVLKDDVALARQSQSLKFDSIITASSLNPDIIKDIDQVSPYGSGNPQPVFVMKSVRTAYAERLKGGHVRCSFAGEDGQKVSGICFGADSSGLAEVLLSPEAKRLHVAGRIKENTWKGRTKIDFHVLDIAYADEPAVS